MSNSGRKIYHYNSVSNTWLEIPTKPEVAVDAAYYIETTNYYAGFSNVTVGNLDTPLPVELNSFTVKAVENQVILHWQTATEMDFKSKGKS